MLAYRGELDPDMRVDETLGSLGGTFRYPFTYGYSCVGTVEQTRSDDVAEGTVVFAFQPHQDRFVAPASTVVVLGTVEPRLATLFPLVETALQICLDAAPVFAEPVAVFGLGTVGLLTCLMLRRAGASPIGVEIAPWRRRAAADLGIETAAPDALRDVLRDLGSEAGIGLAIEASGNPDALRSALESCRTKESLWSHPGTAPRMSRCHWAPTSIGDD